MASQWEHQNEVREALHTIVSDPQLGIPALSSSQVMSNLLKDLLPDAPRETSVLVGAAEAGLAQVLRDHVAQGMDIATASSLTASAFASRTPFTQEACTWVVGELAAALGLAQGGGAGQAPLGQSTQQASADPSAAAWGQNAAPAWGAGPAQGAAAPPGWSPAGQAQGPVAGQGGGGAWPPDQAETILAHGGVGGGPAGPGQGHPPGTRAVPRIWAIATGIVVAAAVVSGVVVLVHRPAVYVAPVEALRKIIRPVVSTCKTDSAQHMQGVVRGLACSTHNTKIGLNAYQFDNSADYQAGLTHLNSITGWNRSAAGKGCPPPAGGSTGAEGWHTLHDPRYAKERPDQFLECYSAIHKPGLLLYLWTFPSQRAILVAGDSSFGASYQDLQNWWKFLTYG